MKFRRWSSRLDYPGGGLAGLGGVHCDTGNHDGPPKSVRTNVIEPLTVMDVAPIKLMFPPDPKTIEPPRGKKVTDSPGPSEL